MPSHNFSLSALKNKLYADNGRLGPFSSLRLYGRFLAPLALAKDDVLLAAKEIRQQFITLELRPHEPMVVMNGPRYNLVTKVRSGYIFLMIRKESVSTVIQWREQRMEVLAGFQALSPVFNREKEQSCLLRQLPLKPLAIFCGLVPAIAGYTRALTGERPGTYTVQVWVASSLFSLLLLLMKIMGF